MKVVKHFLFAMTLLVNSIHCKAQTPSNDAAWILQTSASEEFNSPIDTTNKWHPRYSWGPVNPGAEWNFQANVTQSLGILDIKADTLLNHKFLAPSAWANPPSAGVSYAYQGGAIHTRSNAYKFGFVEVYAKFPTSYYPLWPAAWLNGCVGGDYNEIDFAENDAANSIDGHEIGTNRWVHFSACTTVSGDGSGQVLRGFPLLSAAFHKYAVEWAPDHINIYFDDEVVRTIYDVSGAGIPQNAMSMFLNFAIQPQYAFLPTNWNTIIPHGNGTPTFWPQHFYVDYMRYYKLNTDCSNSLTICTPSSDYSTRAVKYRITAGGSCSPTFNTSDGYTLRATDYVVLDAGTTINDNGSGYFAALVTACPQ